MSSTVNRPTNVKIKEQDVNQKLQLYGIYSAFANGKVPSNKQIDVALNSALASKPLSSPSAKLSEEGRNLVADLRDVIEQAKLLLLTKNEGNLLQDFIWQTQQLSVGDTKLPGAPVDKSTAQQHGNQALDGLRTLGTLMISNGQFRKLLNDATILLRDVAGDAAQSAANRVNPSQEQLAQIDGPAEDNVWHDTPNISVSGLKAQAREQYNKNKPFSRGDAQNALGDATQSAHPDGSRDPADAADLAAQDQQNGTASGVDAQGGAKAGLSNLKDTATDNVPDENQDRARDVADKTKAKAGTSKAQTKDYLGKKMPKERREQTIWRLRKMVVEIQGHQDYQQAIETLLDLAEQYAGHGKNLGSQGAGTVKGAHTDNALTTAEADLRTLIERFANSTSADDLFDAINNIYRDAEKDPELRKWFSSCDTYVRKCLKEQGFIMQDASTTEWNELYDHGQFLLRDRYRDHTNRIIDEFKFLGDQFDQDPQNHAFGVAVQKLFNDLGNDENGKPTFKTHLVKDVSSVILPAAFENVRYVPIPRIEFSDPMMDGIVENLVIESDNLMPNAFEIESDNYFRWGRKREPSRNKNKIMVSVSGVQMDIKDVSYHVNKKQGFPSIKDTGIMDIFMGGSGLSFKIAMETADKSDKQHFFKINTVNVDVKNLNIKLKQSNHKLLFGLVKPLLFRVVRPVVQKVLEKQIRDTVHRGDALAFEIHTEAQRAADAAMNDPENAQNIYSRYVEAAKMKMNQGKKTTQDVADNKKVNMAMTKHDSIFPDINLPGGISTQATKFKELAAKGDKWESPVFGIGSAPESSNIPKIAAVSRKPHNATGGSVRGAQNFESGQSTGTGNRGLTNGSSGFSNQVNQAFDSNGAQDLSLKNGSTNGGDKSGRTTLGANNPVLSGSA